MKKVFFAALALVAMLSVASCKKSDKCTCTYETSVLKPRSVDVDKPEDKKCSDLKSSDIAIAGVKIDASELIDLNCTDSKE